MKKIIFSIIFLAFSFTSQAQEVSVDLNRYSLNRVLKDMNTENYLVEVIFAGEANPLGYTTIPFNDASAWMLIGPEVEGSSENFADLLLNNTHSANHYGGTQLFHFIRDYKDKRFFFMGAHNTFWLTGKEGNILEGRILERNYRFKFQSELSVTKKNQLLTQARRQVALLDSALHDYRGGMQNIRKKLHLIMSDMFGIDNSLFGFYAFTHFENYYSWGQFTASNDDELKALIEEHFLRQRITRPQGLVWEENSDLAYSALMQEYNEVLKDNSGLPYWYDFTPRIYINRGISRELSEKLPMLARDYWLGVSMDNLKYEVVELRGYACANSFSLFKTISWVFEDGTYYTFFPYSECD